MILIFHIIFIGILFYGIIKKLWKQDHRWLLTSGLVLKILAGLTLGLLYTFYYTDGGDTFVFFREAGTIAGYVKDHPDQFWKVLTDIRNSPLVNSLVFKDEPRALFFSVIMAVLHFFTAGNYWLMAVYLSIFSYAGILYFLFSLKKYSKSAYLPGILAFMFLPGFVIWTGVIKESLYIPALCVVFGATLEISYKKSVSTHSAILLISGLFLLWKLKYFFAATSIAVLLTYGITEILYHHSSWLKNRKGLFAGIWAGTFTGLLLLASLLHYNLHIANVSGVLYENYNAFIRASDPNDVFTYFNFDGSLSAYLWNTPVAFFSGLFRPLIFEASNLLQVTASIENLIILVLGVFSLFRLRKNTITDYNKIISILVFIVVADILIAFSCPNFGTLSRYKAGYWPFIVMIILLPYTDFLRRINNRMFK